MIIIIFFLGGGGCLNASGNPIEENRGRFRAARIAMGQHTLQITIQNTGYRVEGKCSSRSRLSGFRKAVLTSNCATCTRIHGRHLFN